ncbi:MAG: glycosyltransferase family 9 protein [Verrucomicrobiales bacterium]|nr:glycosyltransferase family 9 protein [Verrucomicrobiales bacterium]
MKILVISLAGIGDTLFATPLIHELRANFPEATIDVLVMWRGSKSLLENNPHLNTVHQKNLMAESKAGALKFLAGLRRAGYDASLNTFPQSRRHYRIVAKFINAPVRISHGYECSGALDRWLVNKTLPQNYSRHAVENNLALLSPLGANPELPAHRYEIYLTESEQSWAADFVAQQKLSGRPLLGIHVGSGGTKNLALRRWPLESYAELARRLRQNRPELGVLFFGGPEEKAGHEKIRALAGVENLFFPESENLRQTAALIGKCDAFLSVDTALMHVAAAMNVRGQIVIETPTWNKPIEPYANPFTLVKNPAVAGRNLEFYRYDGGQIKGTRGELLRCMSSVTVDEVHATIGRVLAKSI